MTNRRATRCLVIASLFFSMGAHLPAIQAVAWAQMVSDGVSFKKTFDGQHPCALCMKVKRASADNGSLRALGDDSRMDLLLAHPMPVVQRVEAIWPLHPMVTHSLVVPL